MKVLIVDDQDAVREALELLFTVQGLSVLNASSREEVMHFVSTEEVGVVLQDMNFSEQSTSGQEGADLFRAVKALDPDLPVVLMTAWTSLEAAVSLVKEGAADYIAKPWDDEKLVRTVKNLLRLRSAEQENTRLLAQTSRARHSLTQEHDLCGVVYRSAQMHDVVSLAVHVAPSEAPVLISGPTGVGKEKLAEIIQANSRRKQQPFVKVNAGGLPDELLQAELFGAEQGAYTGSSKLRIGRFEAAHGGTLFLDELGNLSLSGQMKLLRVLQTGEFERLGSSTTRKVDVRILSATNADLRKEIAAGRFREDLFFRLNVIELRLPPLSERPDDVGPLAETFLSQNAAGGSAFKLAENVATALMQYEWPGNVRELQNRIQRATLVCRDRIVTVADLALPAAGLEQPAPAGMRAADPERNDIELALVNAGGVVAKAAARLGMSRQALYRRMERLGIVLERRPKV
ncbi:MAG TPA: sigma-54 dependent transcriptional regulator [Myxococcales bacterium]|jgi:DNA-binding NtrC family response regulator|nr:sigma-54 dependent transcriptional regulator [Myxococcales bacterium]